MNQALIRKCKHLDNEREDTRFYGWVLLENGKIRQGTNRLQCGSNRRRSCTAGGVLTPLIDIHSHIGLYEDGLGL